MFKKVILAVIVGIAVSLASILLGNILVTIGITWTVSIGNFFKDYSGLLGLLAALWWYFSGADIKRV